MSEEEKGNEKEIPTKRMIVQVQKDNGEENEAYVKAERYDEIVNSLAESLNDKYDTDVFSGKTMEEMESLDKLLASRTEKESREKSKGFASLLPPKTEDVFTREYENPEEMILDLYSELHNPNTTEEKKQQIQNAIKTLTSHKIDSEPFNIKKMELRPPPSELPKNFTWRQYTRYIQEKSKRDLEKVKNVK